VELPIDEPLPVDDSPLLKGANPQRTCIVTRKSTNPDNLIRFALDADNVVTPDLARKLPGRGAWVLNDRTILSQAIKKNAFARAFKLQVKVPDGFDTLIEGLMLSRVQAALSLAIKSGLASFGFDNVQKSIQKGQAVVLIAANEASPDQLSKLIAGTGLILSEISQTANERLQFLTVSVKSSPQSLLWVRSLSSSMLDEATGRSGLTYIALKHGQGLTPFLTRMTDLARFGGIMMDNK
jgi:uncharacterized protein